MIKSEPPEYSRDIEIENRTRQHRAYEPSPMSWVSNDHYRNFDISILEIIANPPDDFSALPDAVKSAIALNYYSSRAMLTQRNSESLQRALSQIDESDTEVRGLIRYAEEGLIYPDEVLRLLNASPLQSAELAKLTHPYGVRSEQIVDMMNEVSCALEYVGADIKSFNTETARIKFFDDSRCLSQGIFTVKSVIASVGSISVAERRTFAFHADNPQFPTSIRHIMNEATQIAHKITTPQAYVNWHDKAFVQSGFRSHVREHIDDAVLPVYLIPVSTVIYGYKDIN